MNSAPCAPKTVDEALSYLAWASGPDSGHSSAFIFESFTGLPSGIESSFFNPVPCDIGDFGRCSRLVQRFPQFKPHLFRLKKVSREWMNVIVNWEKLDELLASYQNDGDDGAAQKAREILRR